MRSLTVVAVLFSSGLASSQKDVAVVEPSAKAPRYEVLEWKTPEGRPYWYRLPKKIDEKRPPDLLVMLHGTGLDHRWSFANYRPQDGWRRDDIVVSPDGLTPGGGDTFNFVQGKQDGDQIAGLIQTFRDRFPVGRVWLYGHSQGAFFCYWFAGEHPELVDGIVAHAGNVLQVKHGKLQRQKVAIGILHGRADAVVPVDCATRTEKIYREEGYEKVKLVIVEGLTEQSGHWPLPGEVTKLLDWCAEVSTQSAAQALAIVRRELQQEAPDLALVVEQTGKAEELLPKAGRDEQGALAPQIAALREFVDRAVQVHAQALLADPATADPKAGHGAWVVPFLRADAAFDGHKQWQKDLAKVRAEAKRHDKEVEKAQKKLEKPNKAARAAAWKTWRECWLGRDAEALRSALAAALGEAGDADVLAELDAAAEQRAAVDEQGRAAWTEREQKLVEELRSAHPELFATEGEADAAK